MSDFYPDGKKIKVAGEDFVIMPFVLRTRTKVLKIIADICVELAKINPKLRPEDLPNMTATLISAAGDKLIEIYEIVLNKPREWLEDKVTLKDEVEIIKAVVEVNDIPFLLLQVKNLLPKKQKTV